ncbi:MAG TPA: type II secretion system ATPase GspE [Stellaceae bacterium]|jgi:general secretion pathway protein E|nr:type II secretion system ATPase GspE [Stellaceae bacterium]
MTAAGINGAAIKEIDRRSFEQALADRLVSAGKLEPAALDRVARLQNRNDARLEGLLVKLGLVNERDVAEALATELRLPIAETQDYPDEPVLDGAINQKYLRNAGVLPLAERGGAVTLAMVDPLDLGAIRAIEMATGMVVEPRVALSSDIDAAFARLYDPQQAAASDMSRDTDTGADEELLEDVDRLRDLASEGPVIRLVNSLIARAIDSRASDIHIEPLQNRLVVRCRIDGVLAEIASPPSHLRAAIISRIKIMAKLNIAERRLPQDGRIRIAVQGKEFDLRVSSIPTLHGEGVVMRILDRASLVYELGSLGFLDYSLEPFQRVLDQPQGILLVTGPTGSGKTTTLYTSLLRLNSSEKKLFTVEDPIEYQLDGVSQIQVKPQIGLSFAQVLRAILRQDPDIIMVGEMRDLETAEIAIQAALTGHLVLSTLHTNSAAGTITRLLDMGVEDYLITSTLNGVLAQRLVRKLCPHCREPYRVLRELAAELNLPADAGAPTLFRACGCDRCSGIGYHGRVAVIELLVLSDAIRQLILRRATLQEIHRAAVADGMLSMYEDGLRKAVRGITSLEEVLRVTRDL